LQSIGMVKYRFIEKEVVREEIRYFITSLIDVEEFARAVRAHWGIENSLHWCLDVVFREDSCRTRKDNSAENFAVICVIQDTSCLIFYGLVEVFNTILSCSVFFINFF